MRRNKNNIMVGRMQLGLIVLLLGLALVSNVAAFRCSQISHIRANALSTSMMQFESSTRLFEKRDDKGDDKNEPYTNNLDIFGQPKDGKKKQYEDEGDIRGPDRIKSCIPYMLPLIDGDNFGKYIYERIPLLGDLDYVMLRPIVEGEFIVIWIIYGVICQ